MTDFIEIDFLEAGDRGSGDAIAIRHRSNAGDLVYVVDGGYAEDGPKLVDHIRNYYGRDYYINHLVLTLPDLDHASGLTAILQDIGVACVWMNRPWRHVDALLPLFERYQDRDRLVARLRSAFPKLAEIEQIAVQQAIPIRDAFAGDLIGDFTVLSPSWTTYLLLVVESDKTPVPARATVTLLADSASPRAWGEENLKGNSDGTSADNETSIVQFADVCGTKILLTGDAGVRALTEAHHTALRTGIQAWPLHWFQVPHHGSRRNLSSEVLDAWLGPRLQSPLLWPLHHAIISANLNDEDHPKKAVVRALIHRGRRVLQTAGILNMPSAGAPARGWTPATPLQYPYDQED